MGIDWTLVDKVIRSGPRGRGDGPQGACPRPEDLACLVEGGLGRLARKRTIQHLADCPDCAKIVRSLLRLSGEVDRLTGTIEADRNLSTRPQPDHGEHDGHPPGRRLVLAALTACFALAVVSVFLLRQSESPLVRGASDAEIELISPKGGEVITSSAITFRWRPVSNASHYVLDLFTAALERILSGESASSPSFELPEDARRGLVAGRTYFWRVTAMIGDGQETVSKLGEFSIGR